MKKVIFGIILVIGIIGLIYTLNIFKVKNIAAKSTEFKNSEVNIGYSRLRISLPVFVAFERGIFKKYGVNAKLEMYETAQPLMQAMIEGNIDVGGYTALPITLNGMLRSKKELLFISTMIEDKEHRISYLLKGKQSSINSISDLKGTRIGILPTIAYKAWLEAILKKNGLIIGKDVQIQQIAPHLQAKALKSGGVDALFTNDPVATSAIEAGIAEVLSNDVECPKYIMNPFPFGSFNVSKEWAESNPKLYQAIVASLNEAIDYINNNPDDSKQYMKPYLSNQFKKYVSSYPNAKYLDTSHSSIKIYKKVTEKYFKMGIIPKPINIDNYIVLDK